MQRKKKQGFYRGKACAGTSEETEYRNHSLDFWLVSNIKKYTYIPIG